MRVGSTAALVAAAAGAHAWLAGDGTRPPIRAALIRFWIRHRLLRMPVPLTGAAALKSTAPRTRDAWTIHFLDAVASEAADARDLLLALERAWFAARASVAGRRRNSHATEVVDLLAAAPLVSATTLAAALDVAVKTAIRLLDGLVAAGIAVEVTRRSKRRLFGLKGMASLAEVVRPPYRPESGRGRGRPPVVAAADEQIVAETAVPPPLTPIERRAFDYSDLERGMVQLDLVIRRTRRSLDALVRGAAAGGASAQDRDHAAARP